MNISSIMSSPAIGCEAEDSLTQAARLMADHHIGFLPVLTPAGRIQGAITDRDLVCRAMALGKSPLLTKVRECMTSEIVSIGEDQELDQCLRLMKEHRIKRILVIDRNGNCAGVVSQKDIAEHEPASTVGDVAKQVLASR